MSTGRGAAGVAASARRALVLVSVLAASITPLAFDTPAAEAVTPPSLLRTWGQYAAQSSDLTSPRDIAVGPDGLVYVPDISNASVAVFDQSGAFQRRWSATTSPGAVAVSPSSGHVFTLDNNGTIYREFDPTGAVVQTVATCPTPAACINQAAALSVGPDGSVYIADTGRDRIVQFSDGGAYVRTWGGASTTADGKFSNPTAIAVGSDGTVYVGDSARDDIQAFDATGTFLRKWGSSGSATGQFASINGLAVAPDGSVTTTDAGTSSIPLRIQRFAADGTFLTRWGTPGTLPGQFDLPNGAAVATDGSIFVLDQNNLRVQRFTPGGTFTSEWGSYVAPTRVRSPRGVSLTPGGRVVLADDAQHSVRLFTAEGALVDTWTQADNADGRLGQPWDTVVEADGDVLVVDRAHDRIQRYQSDGTPAGGWGSTGTGDGQFSDPVGIALGDGGHVLVSDATDRRVEEFQADGTFVRTWPTATAGGTTFTPGGLDLDAAGNVYVANTTIGRVEAFSPTGAYLRRWASSGATSVTVDRGAGVIYAASCTDARVTRTDLTGADALIRSTPACASDVAPSGDGLLVTEPSSFPSSRVEEYAYPAGAAVTITLALDESSGTMGIPLHLHVTLASDGSVPLTGATTSSAEAADCARSVGDIGPRATVHLDCTYTPIDTGTFSARVTVDTDQTDPVTSAPVSVDVNGALTAVQVREWKPSPTSLADGDPLGDATAGSPGLDVDASGDVHVAGSRTYPAESKVQRFSGDGVFEQEFGAAGTAAGQLDKPRHVGVAPNGDVYETECAGRIQRFTAAGSFDHAWTEERTGSSRTTCSPADVAVGPGGTAYVADAANDRIDVITGDTLAPGWGTTGTGNGQFNTPNGVAVAPDGTVYVLDSGNFRVQHFTAAGAFLGAWGSQGTHLGQFVGPRGIDVDENGLVYVSDRAPNAADPVSVFSADGHLLVQAPIFTSELAVHVDAGGSAHLYTWPYASATATNPVGVIREYVLAAGPVVGATLSSNVSQVAVGGTVDYTLRIDNLGTVPLTGVTIDAAGLTGCTSPVADIAVGANRTVTCSATATPAQIGRLHLQATVDTNETPPSASNALAVQVLRPVTGQFGLQASVAFNGPQGMAANWQGDLYVADCGNAQVQHLSSDGTYLGVLGPGTPGTFNCPVDVAFAGNGDLLVLDQGNRLVKEFTAAGAFVRSWSTRTTGNGKPTAIDVDNDGNVYVADAEDYYYTSEYYCDGFWCGCCIDVQHPPQGNNEVRRFAADGTFLGEWGGYPNRFLLSGLWITSAGTVHLANRGALEIDQLDGTRTTSFGSGVHDVAVDRFGHIWTAGNGTVKELSPGGNLLGQYTVPGATGITVDHDDVYVSNGNWVTKLGLGTPVTTIAGTVKDDGSNAAMAGAYVVALRASDLSLARGTRTEANGFYRMTVPPGEYLLQFFDPAGGHVAEWYDNKPSPGSFAELSRVTVPAVGEVTANAGLARNPAGSITGTVTRGTTRLASILVVALRNGSPAGYATTDLYGGGYTLSGLRPGTYTLVFIPQDGAYLPEFYNDSPGPSGANQITVTSGTTVTANADLAATTAPAPVGSATGTVTADGTGAPIANALVLALRNSDLSLVQAALTSSTGRYSMELPAGSHYLEIASPTGQYQFEWYRDQPNPSSFAQLALVDAGNVANASLAPTTGRIAGTVTDADSGTRLPGSWVVVYGPGGVFGTYAAADGSYSIGGLAPGSYTVVIVDPTGTHRPEYYDDQPGPSTASPVPVTAATTTTVDVSLGAP